MKAIYKSMVGRKFFKLTVIQESGRDRSGKNRIFECKCECGALSKVSRPNLMNGHTKSCGCDFFVKKHNYKHGHALFLGVSKTYRTWASMKERCGNKKYLKFKDYGGRGITVCERWKRFENFLADMGESPPGKTLDRIDNNGNYSPDNCRWATYLEQANNKRNNRFLIHNGIKLTIAQWERRLGLKAGSLRIRQGELFKGAA